MRELTLFDAGPPEQRGTDGLSRDARRTLRNNELLERGAHPATRRPLLAREWGFTCGDCAHAVVVQHAGPRRWWKCIRHRLGLSHSAESDIRKGWPACALFKLDPEDESDG